MKVVSVSSDDWANFAHGFSESLKAVGVDSYSYCLSPHTFGYANHSTVVPIGQLKELTQDADFIVIHHSCIELIPYLSKRKMIHYAAGTKYRQESQHINVVIGNMTTFIALPEFQKLTNNYHYVVGAIDTDTLIPTTPCKGEPIFAHFPSNPGVKGTQRIIETMAKIPVTFVYSTEMRTYDKQIELMGQCDVYIEMLSNEQGGRPYGSFGMTALEAAALGKVVITQNVNNNDLYNNTYGPPHMKMICNEDDLKNCVCNYIRQGEDHINDLQTKTRDWVVKNHSYKATGERVLKILNEL